MGLERHRELLVRLNANPPTELAEIDRLKKAVTPCLPGEYLEFIGAINGGEGFVGRSYVILWRAEDLIAMNMAYEAPSFAAGLFLIGSDGGGEAFAFDLRMAGKPIVTVPFVGMSLDAVRFVALGLWAFFERLAE